MRFKFTLLLIALNIGLWSLLSWLNQGLGVTSPATRVFPPGLPQTAEVFEIIPANSQPAWKLRRTASTWRIEAPYQWDANPQTVTSMLDQLDKLSIETSFPLSDIKTANPLADYGLNEAAGVISLTAPGGKPLSIRIGNSTSPASVYLLDPSGQRVVVAKDSFTSVMEEGLKALRSPNIFNLHTGEVRFLTIQERSPDKVLLERSGTDWKFTSPITALADAQALEGTLQKLLTAPASSFYVPDLATQGLDAPDLRIVLEAANGRRQTLIIGHPVRAAAGQELESPKHYYARLADNNSSAFALAKEFVDPFRSAQKDFRLRRLIPNFNQSNLSSIVITRQGHSLTLSRPDHSSSQWVLADQPARPLADPEIMTEFFAALTTLDATEFVSDSPTREQLAIFATPAATLTLQSTACVSTTLTLAEKDVSVHAQVGGGPSIYRVTQDFLSLLAINPLAYRSRVVEQMATDTTLASLKLEPIEGGPPVFNETIDANKDTWVNKMSKRPPPWNSPDYVTAVRTLEKQALQFVVARYNAARFDPVSFNPLSLTNPPGSEPRFGGIPWKWKLTVEVLLPGETKRKRTFVYLLTERLGAIAQGGGYSPHDTTFFLPAIVVEALGVITRTPTFPEQPLAPLPPSPGPTLAPSPVGPRPPAKAKTDDPIIIPEPPAKPTPF